MPYPSEHAARIRDPDTFVHDSFRSKDIAPGVRLIVGKLADGDGAMVAQAYRFDRHLWTADRAEKWLAKRKIQVANFEPAKEETYKNITSAAPVEFQGKTFPELLAFSGDADVAGDEGGKEIHIQAYGGGPIRVALFPLPAVVDLSALEMDHDQAPVTLDHELKRRVGFGKPENTGRSLSLHGRTLSKGKAVREVLAARRDGMKWRASIGCEVLDYEFVPTGKQFQANGQTFQGPMVWVKRSRLKEITLCTAGADPTSSVQIAASFSPSTGTQSMLTFKKWLKAKGQKKSALTAEQLATFEAQYVAEGGEPVDLAATAAGGTTGGNAAAVITAVAAVSPAIAADREAAVCELKRRQLISGHFRKLEATWGPHLSGDQAKEFADLELKAMADGWSAQDAELAILRKGRPATIAATHSGGGTLNMAVMEAAACHAGGMPLQTMEQYFNPQTLEAADKTYRGRMGLQRMLLEAAWANGCSERFLDDSTLRDVLHYAFLRADAASTMNIPGLLSNLANKFLLEGWMAVESVWREVCRTRPLKDFKPHYSFRFWGDMTLEKLTASGEIKHGKVGEIKYVIEADTYAKMFQTTRKDIINDDLDALTELPRSMGLGAIYALNEIFWTCFLAGVDSQGSDTFTDARGNYLHGATSALGIDSLTQAVQMLREQKNPAGKPQGLAPAWLLVAPKNRDLAKRLYQSTELRSTVATESYPVDNPHAGLYKNLDSAYLASSFAFANANDTKWWLGVSPAQMPLMTVGFLNGQETPSVQSSEADFNTLGIQHRVWHDFGVSQDEYRAAVQSDGQ